MNTSKKLVAASFTEYTAYCEAHARHSANPSERNAEKLAEQREVYRLSLVRVQRLTFA